MRAPAPIARGLKDLDDTCELTDRQLGERVQRCQEEQSRRLEAARAAADGGPEPLRKAQ